MSRRYFCLCNMLHMLAVPLGMALCFLVRRLSEPIGSEPGSYVWGEARAAFVSTYLGWFIQGWHPILPIVGLYLIAYRIFACAYVKRARAIGVHVTLGEVWYCFMGLERGATIADLTKKTDGAVR